MSAPILTLWSDAEAAGGTQQHVIPYVLEGSRMPLPIDRRGLLRFASSRLTKLGAAVPWAADAVVRQSVVRAELLGHGITEEWRLSGLGDGYGGQAVIEAQAEPLVSVLRDVGPMRGITTGGGSTYSQQGVDLTIAQYISSFIAPFLTSLGITWIVAGTIANTNPFTVSWVNWTPLQLLLYLEERSGLEFDFRRNGATDYRLDFVTAIGSSASEVLVAAGRNLHSFARSRSSEGYANVVQAFGGVPEGSTERATSGHATWKASVVSTDDVTLVDRAGGDGPVKVANQYVTPSKGYLLANDGTLQRIDATTTAGVFSLIAGGGAHFTVNDLVEIRKDSSGTLLEEAVDPDATYRVVGTFTDEDQRGERNFSPQPFADGAVSGGVWGRVNANVSGSATVVIKDILPTNRAFPQHASLWLMTVGNAAYPSGTPYRITGATAAVAGVVTLSVSPTITAVTDQAVLIHDRTTLPTGWTDPSNATSKGAIWHIRPTNLNDLTGLANGAYVPATGRVALDGLTPAENIHPGDWLEVISSGLRLPVMLPATVTAGAATVSLCYGESPPSAAAIADNAPIRIVRPFFDDAVASDYALVVFSRPLQSGDTGSAAGIFDLPAITIPYQPDKPNLWLRAGATFRGFGGPGLAGFIEHALVRLIDDNTDAVLAEAPTLQTGISSAEDARTIVQLAYRMTEATRFRIQLVAPGRLTGSAGVSNPFVPMAIWHWQGLFIGSDDPNTPPVWGSHATRLRQYENTRLALSRQLPTEWRVTARELVNLWGLSPAEAQLQRGGDVRFVVPLMGIDDVFRVIAPDYSLTDEGDTSFVLATKLRRDLEQIDRRFAQQANRSKPKASSQVVTGDVTEAPVPAGFVDTVIEDSVSSQLVPLQASVPVIEEKVEAALAGQGSAGAPTPPAGTGSVWSPAYTGQGAGTFDLDNMHPNGRGIWTPFLLAAQQVIDEVSIVTDTTTGSPGTVTAQIVFAEMAASRLIPETIRAFSAPFTLDDSVTETLTGLGFAPAPGTYYVVGATILASPFVDGSNFRTIKRWGDPIDSLRQIPNQSTGGDYSASASFFTTGEVERTVVGGPWDNASIDGYLGEAYAFWFKFL